MERRWLLPVLLCLFAVVLAGCSGFAGDASPDEPAIDTLKNAEINGTLAVHNINVGQSVSTLIVGPTGETMLIDTGNFSDDGKYVLEYLQRHDIDRIDYLVASHNDADHIGGNAAVIEYYETQANGIGAIYDSGITASTQTYSEYLDAVGQHNVTLYRTEEGDTILFEGVDVQVLGPPAEPLSQGDRNENSIVLRFEFGQTSFLYTGDAEDKQESYIVDKYGSDLNATVYKASHHGSYSSSSDALLDAVAPQAVVVSSGFDSQYGHPHNDVLQKFVVRDIATYWTATHGNVVFVVDGREISIQTQQPAPTDPLALDRGDASTVGSDVGVTERQRIVDNSDMPTEEQSLSEDEILETSRDLAIKPIQYDAAGDDYENLNGEYVVFENTGNKSLNISGWTIEDEISRQYTFPAGVTLEPGATVTVRSGSGTDTEIELYWGADIPVWNNGGDTVIVRTADSEPVLLEEYP